MTSENRTEAVHYTVAWTLNNVLIRWPCVVCGGETGKQDILAVAYAGSESYENEIGMVCDECVNGGPAEAVARLTQHAERLEARAAKVRGRASAAWQFPPEGQTRHVLQQDWEGHNPLPSFLLGKSELVTARDLMPSGYLGERNPPDDTCYVGCPRCAEMAELSLSTVTTQDRGSEERGGRHQLPLNDSAPRDVWDDGFFDTKGSEVVA